jgi:transcriptional regulator with XRE-family HTH domain
VTQHSATYDRSPIEQSAAEPTNAGLPPKARTFAPLLVGLAATTLSWNPTAATTLHISGQIAVAGWTSGAQLQPKRPTSELASAVRRLKERSGLSWQQLADAFGVSRRAVHFWSNGGNMTAPNVDRLRSLEREVSAIDTGDPKAVRAALLAPAADGSSIFQAWIAAVTPRRLVERPSVAAVLDTFESDEYHRGQVVGSVDTGVALEDF